MRVEQNTIDHEVIIGNNEGDLANPQDLVSVFCSNRVTLFVF